MDILDLLIDATKEFNAKHESQNSMLKTNLENNNEDESAESGEPIWIENKDTTSSSGKKRPAYFINTWETMIEKLDSTSLVWCHIGGFFKAPGVRPWVPAVIRDNSRGALIKDAPWPIPDDMVVIEYICMTKKDPTLPRYVLQNKNKIRPYYENVKDAVKQMDGKQKKLSQKTLSFLPSTATTSLPKKREQWSLDSLDNMKDLFHGKFHVSQANALFEKVQARANALLDLALSRNDAVPNNDDDEEVQESRRKDLAERQDQEKLEEHVRTTIENRKSHVENSDESEVTIGPDTWLSFEHPIFKKTLYKQVVEVTACKEQPLTLTCGTPLPRGSTIRVMKTMEDGTCDMLQGSKSRKIETFKLSIGKSKMLRSIHDATHRDAVRGNDRIHGGGGVSKSGEKSSRNSSSGKEKKHPTIPANLSTSFGNSSVDSFESSIALGRLASVCHEQSPRKKSRHSTPTAPTPTAASLKPSISSDDDNFESQDSK